MVNGHDSRDVPRDDVGGGVGVKVEDDDFLASRVGDSVPARVRHARALDVGGTTSNVQYEYAR